MNCHKFKIYEMNNTLDWIDNRLDTAEETSAIEDKTIENIQNETYRENRSLKNKQSLVNQWDNISPSNIYICSQ